VASVLRASVQEERREIMRRPRSKRGLVVVGVVVLVGAIGIGVASAVVTSTVLADTNTVRERIVQSEFTPSADQPRFSSGWHIHPGLAVVQVQEGQLKIFQNCRTYRVQAGGTYIEVPYLPVNAEATRSVKWTTSFVLANSAPGAPDRSAASEPACPSGDDDEHDGGDH
jgi:hypothetical protein